MNLDSLRQSYPIVIPIFLVVWMALGWGVKKAVFVWIRHLTKKTVTNLDDILVESAELPSFLLVAAAGLAISYHTLLPPEIAKPIVGFMPAALKILVIFSLVLFVDKAVVGLVSDYSSQHEFLRVAQGLLSGLLHLVFFGLGLLIILDSLGISITPIIASLGIGSLAVALALQPTLENLFAGVQLVIDQPVRPGQFIKLESGEEGFVEKVGWRSTWIRQLSNNTVIIPNHQLTNSRVLNYHYPTKDLIVTVDLGVHYDSDLEKVERVTVEVAEKIMKTVSGAVADFQPLVRYGKFDSSSINFTVIMRAQQFIDGGLIRHEFIKALASRFAQEEIVIPYPITALNTKQEKSVFTPN